MSAPTSNPPAAGKHSAVLVNDQEIAQSEYTRNWGDERIQSALLDARERHGHALCLCRHGLTLKLQIRIRELRAHLAVWPDEGHLHDPNCVFFRDDLSDVARHSIVQAEPRTGVGSPYPQSPAPEAPTPLRRDLWLKGERSTPTGLEEAINLGSLASLLWVDADLGKWHHGWQRDWGRCRFQLQRAAGTLRLNGIDLEGLIFCPRPYREAVKSQLNAEWQDFSRRVAIDKDFPHILIAPVRAISSIKGPSTIAKLRHLSHPIGLSKAAADWLTRWCKAPMRYLEASEGPTPEVIGFFVVEASTRGGLWARAAWLMAVHPRIFIPTQNLQQMHLVDALLDQGHDFERLLNAYAPSKRTTPDWIIRHVLDPDGLPVPRAALDLVDRSSDASYLESRRRIAADLQAKGIPTWTWLVARSMQGGRADVPLPPHQRLAKWDSDSRFDKIDSHPDIAFHWGACSLLEGGRNDLTSSLDPAGIKTLSE